MISVVLPAYNEAQALPVLLSRLSAVSSAHFQSSLKVIVVDDGSTDGTGAQAHSTRSLSVRLITHAQNRGLSGAIDTGLRAALESAGDDDIIVTMDADDTHTPWLIPRMVGLVEEGNDVVVASRYQPGARIVGVPRYRQMMSNGVSFLFRVVYPIPGAKDYSCGFRAYRAPMLREAFERWGTGFISERGFSCMIDILIKLHLLGGLISEVPMILRYDRKPGASKMNVRETVGETLRLLVRRRMGRLD